MTDETHTIDAAETLPQLIRAAAACYGDDPAITLSGEGIGIETLSFAGLERASAELARGLLARGAGKGTRVGIIAGNGPFFATAFAAIARMGGIAMPISTMIRANELVRVLRQVRRRRTDRPAHFPRDRLCPAADRRAARARHRRRRNAPHRGSPLSALDRLDRRCPAARRSWILPRCCNEVTSIDEVLAARGRGRGERRRPDGRDLHLGLDGAAQGRASTTTARCCSARTICARCSVRSAAQRLPAALPMFWVGGLMMALLPNLDAGATTICTERTLRNSRMAMGSVLADEDVKRWPAPR